MLSVLERVRATGAVNEVDVLEVRQSVYPDGVVDPREIDTLFAIDEAAVRRDAAWTMLFSEVVCDYLVNQETPAGYVSEDNADWLVQRIGKDGVVKTATELECLVRVLETAERSPASLSAYALSQVKQAVLRGDGPVRAGGALTPGEIGEPEVALIRRILYAFGGDGAVAISRAEAEVLFDINDAVTDADNAMAWSELFVKAAANFLMAASGYSAPPRDVALARDAWLEAPAEGVGSFFLRMASGGIAGVLEAYRQPPAEKAVWDERNTALAAETAANERVSQTEAEWLAARIGRDGQLHENERALLRFIREESPQIHEALKPLIAAA